MATSASSVMVHSLVALHAQKIPDAVAIAAPTQAALTYGQLHNQVTKIVATLAAMGLSRGQRIAIVLPNGADLAVAILAVSACATSVPLNPAYGVSEFEAYFVDTQIDAVLVQAGLPSPAIAAAQKCHLPIIELCSDSTTAGMFTLTGTWVDKASEVAYGQPEDIALVLHTSGTTSRSKIVPLTHANLAAAAQNVIAALELQPSDRCLSIMPLFHSQGLIAGLIASLSVGGSVVCTTGFNTAQFFNWLAELRPTWYTAVPTVHQAILGAADQHPEILASCPLRFIRSASASLPVPVFRDLENTFRVPIIEAYGLTEAFQITSNRRSQPQKVRSVGVPVGTEVAIVDSAGNFLNNGEVGEVVTRGGNVMRGYENNPSATASAFLDGWLRTGDQGYLDDEGYLFLTGRLKDIINRGGEKITPLEVEEVLLEHPAVAQAVTFAVPHPRLGEDLAAAVVLRQTKLVTEAELREFVAARLAEFKTPSQVLILAEIPKTATGKFRRSELATKLADQLNPAYLAPRNVLETKLADIWAATLDTAPIGVHDNFFALGGDSLQAVQLISVVEQQLGRQLPNDALFQSPTIAQMATFIQGLSQADTWNSLLVVKTGGTKPPVFLVHDVEGETILYLSLARHLEADRPVYALRPMGREGFPILHTRLSEMVEHYITCIRRVQPQGPYYLGGLCAGGLIGFLIALELQAQGEKTEVYLFDAADGKAAKKTNHFQQQRLNRLAASLQQAEAEPKLKQAVHFARVASRKAINFGLYMVRSRVETQLRIAKVSLFRSLLDRKMPLPGSLKNLSVRTVYRYALREYAPQQIYQGKLVLFRATENLVTNVPGLDDEPFVNLYADPLLGWESRAATEVMVFDVPGGHSSMLQEPHVRILAEKIQICLNHPLETVNPDSLEFQASNSPASKVS
jgi:acyl-CoA synthetase (AMP-forming)/AMP-acid ligase II/thioesterase domain-containing protein/acyl carrier protein